MGPGRCEGEQDGGQTKETQRHESHPIRPKALHCIAFKDASHIGNDMISSSQRMEGGGGGGRV